MALPRFPYPPAFTVRDRSFSSAEVIARLAPLLGDERRARIADVIDGRTYSITPVLEGLYDRGNASAVLRTAEALGYQRTHMVTTLDVFKQANRVTQGAEKWLDIVEHPTTTACLAHLRERGYRIVATCLEDAQPIGAFDFSIPTAIFFGNEKEGVSDELLHTADARLVVPMPGFTGSFNISVAAALILYHVAQDRTNRLGAHGDLSEEEKRILTAEYYMRSVGNAEGVLSNERP